MHDEVFPLIKFNKDDSLELEEFKTMDYYAVNNYDLPIELMMENAGLQLASFVASFTTHGQSVKIGAGNGNNGGGGLVAARRLAAWGYNVYIDVFSEITKELPLLQLKRSLKFGAKLEPIKTPNLWVDAYLGFSQRLPLPSSLKKRIVEANNSKAIKISLDIPTGFTGDLGSTYFKADKILTLAYPKKILFNLPISTELYVADLGIPKEIYAKFNAKSLPFRNSNILKIDFPN